MRPIHTDDPDDALDASITPSPTPPATETPWSEVLTEIEDLLAGGNYNWARETLEGIYETIERTHTVSVAQQVAITNISEGGRRSRGRSSANYFRHFQGRR